MVLHISVRGPASCRDLILERFLCHKIIWLARKTLTISSIRISAEAVLFHLLISFSYKPLPLFHSFYPTRASLVNNV